MRSKRPSEFVGEQVRDLRTKRNWKQTDLAARLEELGCPGWRQSKIAKIERGQMKRLAIEDILELAVALDVAPIYLLAPPILLDEAGTEMFKVRIGPQLDYWPKQVRAWIEGARPLLSAVHYRTNAQAHAAARFYFVESRPFGDWSDYEQVAQYLSEPPEETTERGEE